MTKTKTAVDLDGLIQKLNEAKNALTQGIMEEMDKAARKHRLDKMVFFFTSDFYRGGKQVECEAIEKLEGVFLDEINQNGFLAAWTRAEGWNP